MKPLRRNVGIFSEKGGTIGWLIQPDSIVVVDTQFREQAGHLIDEIKKFPSAPMPYLINTHHHGDHTSGNIAFKGLAQHVLAHENSKTNQMNNAKKNGNEAEQLYPDMTFTDRWQQQVGDEFIDIQYWGPAHTNGDSIIHFQHANIAHVGDLMFNRKYPYIDKGAGAMIENWIQILQQLQSYFNNDTLFIFGHANDGYQVTGNKDDLAAFADYLTAVMEFVRNQLKAGKTKDEIMAATEIPGAIQWTGDGIQRSLSAAIEELSE
ncbi:MAG TPA: MBL fold metallo-hydrolase [Saprospiraceae bacterium]|nr:MBL fold metallo-hydrolase [Saprospiraceae bacterium]